ncbi:hypothetical protein [Streptomyces sp. H27-C3]|uniref:hypothetical protein n=1 Tax=Streptomyces sp. H27-C3 TaxID=3046305 RepID=UPI0024B8BC99|nr:hypothetical protein [Streptomyces sp. H27-C3]MDJ0466522.1 hypothetical protein [Streptomyces sp. H27-C3]
MGFALLAARLLTRSPTDAPPAGAARLLLRALWPHPRRSTLPSRYGSYAHVGRPTRFHQDIASH